MMGAPPFDPNEQHGHSCSPQHLSSDCSSQPCLVAPKVLQFLSLYFGIYINHIVEVHYVVDLPFPDHDAVEVEFHNRDCLLEEQFGAGFALIQCTGVPIHVMIERSGYCALDTIVWCTTRILCAYCFATFLSCFLLLMLMYLVQHFPGGLRGQ